MSFGSVGASAGQVIQVVGATSTSNTSISSTSFVTLGVSASITPSSATSKIFIIITFGYEPSSFGAFNIDRNGTLLSGETNGFGSVQVSNLNACTTLNFLDSPNSTSSRTYTLFGRVNSGQTLAMQTRTHSIVLMEIAG